MSNEQVLQDAIYEGVRKVLTKEEILNLPRQVGISFMGMLERRYRDATKPPNPSGTAGDQGNGDRAPVASRIR